MDQALTSRIESALLADQLERSFRGGAWHGPAVCEVLETVDAKSAARSPFAGAHCIWEIVSHLTAWLDIADARAAGGTPDIDSARDWPAMPVASEAAWQDTLAALNEAHRRLHATVLALDDDRLSDPVAGSDPTLRGLLLGILQHNTYHAGQIALIARAAAADEAS